MARYKIGGWNKGLKGVGAVGIKNGMWKGNKIGYSGIHMWLKKAYGRASCCEDCGLSEMPPGKLRYFHWSNISGKYLRERSDWRMLCVRCHKIYDISKLTVTRWNGFKKGHKPWSTGLRYKGKPRPDMKGKPAWNKGTKMWSEEARRKMSETRRGRIPWNKGKKMSEEFRKQISIRQLGKTPWNKGLKLT